MNKLATTLIAAFVLFASPISAEDKPKQTKLGDLDCSTNQIAKYFGTAWECADERGGVGDSGMALVDSTGAQIGPVLMFFDPQSALIEIEVGAAKWAIAAHIFNFFGGIGADPRIILYHESSDCSGVGYLPRGLADPSIPGNQTLFRVPLGSVLGTLETPRVYSAGSNAIPKTITARSIARASRFGPVCNQQTIDNTEVYDVSTLDTLDLSVFTPPFRLNSSY